MITPTHYWRPATLAEAIRHWQHPNSIAVAGGALTLTGLTIPYEQVIDLQDVAELKQIERTERGLEIGGAVRLKAVVEEVAAPEVLKQALTRALAPNTRNGAAVGESLITPRPLREWLAALTVLAATVHYIMKEGLSQEQPVDQFVRAVHQENVRGLVTRIVVPRLDERTAVGTAFVARTPADAPIVNAAVLVRVGEGDQVEAAWVAIGGASAEPVIRLDLPNLTGNPLTETTIAQAARPIIALVKPVADYQGSVEYRREMAQVCVQRALLEAYSRLK